MTEIVIPNGSRYHLYAAGAGQTAFTYSFPILTDADLAMKRRRAGVTTLLTLGVDFTVAGAGTQPGGTVTLTAAALAGDLYAIYGDETGERLTDFLGLTFTNTDINAELDRIAQALLDIRRTLGRRLGVDETDDASGGLTLPHAADRANKLFAFSSTGAPEARASTGTELFALANAGPPAGSVGVDGDLALGTDGSIWLKTAGAWGATAINLRGAVGPAGSIGTLPDGTPAAPGLAFGADPDTGLHRDAANSMAAVAGGAIRTRTNTTGFELVGNGVGLTLPEHASAPATPAAATLAVYNKTSGKPFFKDPGGWEFPLYDADAGVADHRLTLTSGTPVMTADTTGTTLYVTPFNGSRMAFFVPSKNVWDVKSFAEQSLALSGLTAGKNYDVFLSWAAGAVPTIELVAWTSDTVRATAIVRQDGVWCKSGDLTRRLVGTVRALSATQIEWKLGGTGIGGVAASLGLWHANPKVRVPVRGTVRDSTDSWTYGVTAWRAANNSTSMRVSLLDGDGSLSARASFTALGSPAAGLYTACGVGLDSVTALSAQSTGCHVGSNGVQDTGVATYSGTPGLGWHFLQALEARVQGSTAVTFFSDNGLVYLNNGLSYEVMV